MEEEKSVAAAAAGLLLFLPGEIIVDILSRLPVDSVLQCKLVCKTWRSIVDHDPTFLAMHTHKSFMMIKSVTAAAAAPYCFFLYVNQFDNLSRLSTYRLHFGEYHEDNANNNNTTSNNHVKLSDKPVLEKYYHNKENNIKTIYSCNGLILIATSSSSNDCDDDDSMMVFNPVTKEYVHLPPSGEKEEEFVEESNGKIRSLSRNSRTSTGFGYHPITKEYKIVRIKYFPIYDVDEDHDGYIYVYIYTLGRSSWSIRREIKVTRASKNNGFPSCRCYGFGRQGVHLNGVVHWIAMNEVLSFDLADEEFKILPSPPPTPRPPEHIYTDTLQTSRECMDLGVLGGCLCYYRLFFTFNTAEIWVLSKHKEVVGDNEDEEKENSDDNSCSCWIKKFTSPSICEEDCSFVSALESGNILFLRFYHEHLHFVSYDPETGNIYEHDEGESFLNPSDRWSGIIPYVKSFVSLKALGEEDAKYICCGAVL